jgi:hypothetical protein
VYNPNISFYRIHSISAQVSVVIFSCSLPNRSINDAIDDFLADTVLTQYVLSTNSFDTKVQADISLIQTFYEYNKTTGASLLYETSFSYINGTICRCGSDSTCSSSLSGFFNLYEKETRGAYISYDSLIANVTGFVVGYYAIVSLLQPTLECLFSASCLSGILTFFSVTNVTMISHHNSNETKFPLETTIDTLISNLFMENWLPVSSFDEYYTECNLSLCTYILT